MYQTGFDFWHDLASSFGGPKAVLRRRRRHGIRVSCYDLSDEQLRRYFEKTYSYNVYRQARLHRAAYPV